MAQVTEVTSEALQSVFRRLLPSQAGFGEDLQATNVITPIIDLTPSAEGSALPNNLQTALALANNSTFQIENTTTTMVNSAGFWRIYGNFCFIGSSSSTVVNYIDITDGSTTQTLQLFKSNAGDQKSGIFGFDFVVFVNSGETVRGVSSETSNYVNASVRQLADVNGNLVNPTGYTPQ
jgi:hypothetical protein